MIHKKSSAPFPSRHPIATTRDPEFVKMNERRTSQVYTPLRHPSGPPVLQEALRGMQIVGHVSIILVPPRGESR